MQYHIIEIGVILVTVGMPVGALPMDFHIPIPTECSDGYLGIGKIRTVGFIALPGVVDFYLFAACGMQVPKLKVPGFPDPVEQGFMV
jgi:hypothetical protein